MKNYRNKPTYQNEFISFLHDAERQIAKDKCKKVENFDSEDNLEVIDLAKKMFREYLEKNVTNDSLSEEL